MIASIIAKLSTAVARWPKKLIAPSSPNPPEFKELDAPALLGRLKMDKYWKLTYTSRNSKTVNVLSQSC